MEGAFLSGLAIWLRSKSDNTVPLFIVVVSSWHEGYHVSLWLVLLDLHKPITFIICMCREELTGMEVVSDRRAETVADQLHIANKFWMNKVLLGVS